MKAVILAGGLGTRISEETGTKPKPMVEIGGMPILWHIMKIYAAHGVNEFIICCGYKGYVIKEYFANYFLHMSNVTFDFGTNDIVFHEKRAENWKVTLVDTGDDSMTGGRMLAVKEFLEDDEAFCFTYGDGLADINISDLLRHHKESQKLATVTTVYPPGRFGAIKMNGSLVESFKEKPSGDGEMINGGFFVLSPKVIEHIADSSTVWEQGPLETLAKDGELNAFRHDGFWQPMDTLRDKNRLQTMWEEGVAPWKVW